MLKLAGRMTRRVAALLLVASTAQAQGAPEPVRLAAAGSLTEAMGEVARAFAAAPGNPTVVTTFGPSGLLRERIERGDLQAEVFFPASFDHALRLQQEGRTAAPAVIFVRNRLCAFARPGIPATTETLLARKTEASETK